MTGSELWTLFVGAKVAAADLRSLGEDVGYLRDNAGAPAQRALLKLAVNIKNAGGSAMPSQIFGALKDFMPGIFSRKSLLEGLGSDYDKSLSFTAIRPGTRDYIAKVASKLGPIGVKSQEPVAKSPATQKTTAALPTARGMVTKSAAQAAAPKFQPFATESRPAPLRTDAYFLAKGIGLVAFIILIFHIGVPGRRTA